MACREKLSLFAWLLLLCIAIGGVGTVRAQSVNSRWDVGATGGVTSYT